MIYRFNMNEITKTLQELRGKNFVAIINPVVWMDFISSLNPLSEHKTDVTERRIKIYGLEIIVYLSDDVDQIKIYETTNLD